MARAALSARGPSGAESTVVGCWLWLIPLWERGTEHPSRQGETGRPHVLLDSSQEDGALLRYGALPPAGPPAR